MGQYADFLTAVGKTLRFCAFILLLSGVVICATGTSQAGTPASLGGSRAENQYPEAAHDSLMPLDPTMQWNTFMGGQYGDDGQNIAVDAGGNSYVTGSSTASWGAPVNPYAAGYDAFVAKLDSNGNMLWNTFMGSSSSDQGHGIAVDSSGDVYVTGPSSATWGSPLNAHSGGGDSFVAKLNTDGVLQWNTFMGPTEAWAIVADGGGNLYVTGRCSASWGTPVDPYTDGQDVFAAKLSSGGAMFWNTFMGSTNDERGNGAAVDGNGNLWVTGQSYLTWGSPVSAHAGGWDGFAAKLTTNGTFLWHTFMGSAAADYGHDVGVDSSGNAYVSGRSGATWGTPVNPYDGGADGFAAKLDGGGNLVWNTFMGSWDTDEGLAIAVDPGGSSWVVGESDISWGSPVVPPPSGGYPDVFVAELDSSGVLQWNTFMGCANYDRVTAAALEPNGRWLFVVGDSRETWGTPINPYNDGLTDTFAAKLGLGDAIFSDGFESGNTSAWTAAVP